MHWLKRLSVIRNSFRMVSNLSGVHHFTKGHYWFHHQWELIFITNIYIFTMKTRGKLYFWLKITMKRFHEFERSDNDSTRLLITLDVRTRRRSFLVLVRLMPKLVWSGIRFFPIAKIFSNVTNFIATIASDLKKIFGLEDPFKSRILRYTFSLGLVTAINRNGVRWKFSEFMVVLVDLELILGCKIFKRSLISEQR